MNANSYSKVMQLTPETTNEELRKLYSGWHRDYDKVSKRHFKACLHRRFLVRF